MWISGFPIVLVKEAVFSPMYLCSIFLKGLMAVSVQTNSVPFLFTGLQDVLGGRVCTLGLYSTLGD